MAYWGEIEFVVGQYNIEGNYTPVTANFYAVSDSGSAWKNDPTYPVCTLDGTTETKTVSSYNFGNNKKLLLGSVTKNVPHNSDGTKTVYASFNWNAGNSYINTVSAENSRVLPTIPRYANFTEHYIVSTGTTSITVKWNADAGCDAVQYSLNGGDWQPATFDSLMYTISGLEPNTYYNVRTRIKRADSQLWTESETIYGRTYPLTIPTIALEGKGLDYINVSSNCNVSVSQTRYRIKTPTTDWGVWQSSSSFSNLKPNSIYSIQVEKVGSESGAYGYAAIEVRTYDIARFTSYSNFNLGDNLTINYTNPSGVEVQAGIYGKDGATKYAPYRKVTGNKYTFNFTDEELDTMYKAMGKNNYIELDLYLATNNNTYRELKPITIYLTGNQKTGHINIEGNYKRSKKWVNVGGTYKRCVRWNNVSGVWKRCI